MALIAALPHTSKLNTDYNEFSDVFDNDARLLQEINGNISNTNIAANAAIAPSKLAPGTQVGQILVTNSAGVYQTKSLEGHITINSEGQVTISDTTITTSKIVNGAVTPAKLSFDVDSMITAKRLDQFAAPTGNLSIGSQRLTNVATPTAATDAATKGYADALAFAAGNVTPDADATTKGKIQLAGDLTGSAASPQIAADAVGTTEIANAAVTTAKVADGAITGAKIASGVLDSDTISPFLVAGL